MQANKLISSIPQSATMAITKKAVDMRVSGYDVLSFSAGEPDFDTPGHIKEAAIKAIQEGQTKYTSVGGSSQLKEAIRARVLADSGLEYLDSEIIVSNGAKHTINNLLKVAIEPGDEVIIFAPYWVSYPSMVRLAGGEPIIVKSHIEQGFIPDVAEVEAVLARPASRIKGVIMCNPVNPTGAGYDRAFLSILGRIILENDLWVIADEIYDKLVFNGHEHISFPTLTPDLKRSTALVGGVSKNYAMTGWRIGWAAGPEWWIGACHKLQSQETSNPSSISQAATIVALTGDQWCVDNMRKAYEQRGALVNSLLNEITGIRSFSPQGAFYVFPDIQEILREGESDVKWAQRLLEEAYVAVVPGEAFGAPGHIRLSFACSDEAIVKGVTRLGEFVLHEKG